MLVIPCQVHKDSVLQRITLSLLYLCSDLNLSLLVRKLLELRTLSFSVLLFAVVRPQFHFEDGWSMLGGIILLFQGRRFIALE